MKSIVLIVSILAVALGCEKKSDQTLITENTSADSMSLPENNGPVESSTIQNCYLGLTGKDSVFVSLDDNLGTFTGKMRYKNSEKDNSTGDLIGTKNGDTLKLNYTFASEGTTSEREIYLLMKNGNLIEGIGDHKMEAKKELYADTSKLIYSGQVFKKAECKDFEKNFSVK